MTKKRANSEGNICKRKDSRWEGRYRNEQSGPAIVMIENTDEYIRMTESSTNNHVGSILSSGWNSNLDIA